MTTCRAVHIDREVRLPRLILAASLVIPALFLVSLSVGYTTFDLAGSISQVLRGQSTLQTLVLLELRLPRALLGLLVGFSLGTAGAALQGLFRNPLADPGVVGVSGAAAFGAVVTFYSGLAAASALAVPLGGLAGAGLATAALLMLARQGAGTTGLILGGVALGSLSGALTALALNLAPSPYAATEIMFWLMGSLADRSMSQVWLVLPFMLAGWALMLAAGRALDALTLGEDTAASLGIDVDRARLMIILGASAAVGSSVAAAGAIGFVGLVVPHLIRPLVGYRAGSLLIASGLGGAALTLGADIGVRVLPVRPELKLGVVTAIIGAPFLIGLLWRMRGVRE